MATINKINVNSTEYDLVGSVFYGSCSTAAGTAAKTASINGKFTLYTGATVAIKFTNANTAANPTLNVDSTGAKAIYYHGAAIPASYLKANCTYTFVYNGTQWDFVGDVDTNTTYTSLPANGGNADTVDNKHASDFATAAQGTKADNALPKSGGNLSGHIYLTGAKPASSTASTSQIVFGTSSDQHVAISSNTKAIVINPNTTETTNQIVLYLDKASQFPQGISGNATSATRFQSSQSVALTGDVTGSASSKAGWSVATTLANSGVTAGSYGPSANASPAHGNTFSVPYITVDAKGRVTSASTKTITLPADNNTVYTHPSTHPASMITAGTFASEQVYAKCETDYFNARIRNILLEQDYGMGAPLAIMGDGDIALMYE